MKVAVIGAGAMGRGIAQVSATAGHEVLIYDVVEGAAAHAVDAIHGSLDQATVAGRITEESSHHAKGRLAPVTELRHIADAHLVIEAIIEDLGIKRATFQELEQLVGPDAVLASNTSSLAIGAVASTMSDPDRLIGLHFFNPVPAMKLVEIVTRPQNNPSTVAAARKYVDSLGKTGIEVLDSPGFLVNFAGRALNTEALAIQRDNIASVTEVDRIARDVLGFRLGPFELMDLTGVDVNFPVTDNLFEHHFADPRLRTTWQHRYLFEVGRLGRKTGGGFYSYGEDALADATAQEAQPHGQERAAPAARPEVAVRGSSALKKLVRAAGMDSRDDAGITLVDPVGEDLLTHARARGLPYPNVVGIDTHVTNPAVITMMVPPGAPAEAVARVRAALESVTPVVEINESPGFIAQRLLAAVVNLGCQIAQYGIAAPADIDRAVELGLRYPRGPLAWADHVGPELIVQILDGLHASTQDPRYEASAWLRRRAHAGISCLTQEHLPATSRQTAPPHGA